jgi:hypothetical protein
MKHKMLRFGGLAALAVASMISNSSANADSRAAAPTVTTVAMATTVTRPEAALEACPLSELPGGDLQLIPMTNTCLLWDGTFCSTPGQRRRCNLTPNEPGLCYCTNARTYSCS